MFGLYLAWIMITISLGILIVTVWVICSHFLRKGIDKFRKMCYNKDTK